MQRRLRPQLELFLGDKTRQRVAALHIVHRPVSRGEIAGPRPAGLVDDIDRIALAHEILRPALAAVGGAGVIGARHGTAVHHDDRIGMRLLRRDAHLDIHLMADIVLAVDCRRPGVDVEEAVARQHQRRLVGGLRRPGQECDGDGRGDNQSGRNARIDNQFIWLHSVLPVEAS